MGMPRKILASENVQSTFQKKFQYRVFVILANTMRKSCACLLCRACGGEEQAPLEHTQRSMWLTHASLPHAIAIFALLHTVIQLHQLCYRQAMANMCCPTRGMQARHLLDHL